MSAADDCGGVEGMSLFDLFRAEAETHCQALSAGLLALESRPEDRTSLESLMRAAHSMKGAARIVGLDSAVVLAHAIEDALVAIQRETGFLASGRIDQLLRGADLLGELASVSESDVATWVARCNEEIDSLRAALSAPTPASAPASTPGSEPPSSSEPSAVGTERSRVEDAAPIEQRSVRVGAEVIDRILRLAGEMSVETRRFQVMRDRLHMLKERLLDLDESLEALGEEGTGGARLAEARSCAKELCAEAAAHLEATNDLSRRVEENAEALYRASRASRMRPFGDSVHGFRRLVRDLARQLSKEAALTIVGRAVPVDRDILARLEAPLNHMLRNALDHGIEAAAERSASGKPPCASLRLEARHQAGRLVVSLSDDGRGIDPERVRAKAAARGLVTPEQAAGLSRVELLDLLFRPGFSTASQVTEISGRGVGLDVVRATAHELGGTASIDSEVGVGTTFRLELPLTLSVLRAAVVEIAGEPYACPLARLERVATIDRAHVTESEGVRRAVIDGARVSLVHASTLLGLKSEPETERLSVIVLGHRLGGSLERYGLVVARFEGESDLAVRPLDARLGRVPHVAAAAVTQEGLPILVLDVDELAATAHEVVSGGGMAESAVARPRRILVVDDSPIARETARRVLGREGYQVELASDGAGGLEAATRSRYDLIVTDIDMPRMNGLELVAALRRLPNGPAVRVIIVSDRDRDGDRIEGLRAGADAYLTKGTFRDDAFARTVRHLLGVPETTE